MKKILFSLIMLALAANLFSQPVIDKNDMPSVNDTLRLSITNDVNGIDYTLTGPDYTWDFSSLIAQSQRLDTFVTVSSTPLLYQVEFNNPLDSEHRASYALARPDITQLPSVQFTEIYYFFRASDYTYTQVGQGAKINSVPTPIKYNDPELLYTFPLTYGVTDSSQYEYHLSIPSLGYYGETKKRVNVVDGWGTLITPYATIPSVRVFSTTYIHDTIFMDTLGMGFAQDRIEKEYKWLADTMGLPALNVTKRGQSGNTVSVEYRDQYFSGTGISTHPYTLTFFTLYPNPVSETSKVHFALANKTNVSIEILDVTGRKIAEIANEVFPEGFSSLDIGENISSLGQGIYFVFIKAGSNSKTLKFSVD